LKRPNAPIAPGNGASADRRFEECVTAGHFGSPFVGGAGLFPAAEDVHARQQRLFWPARQMAQRSSEQNWQEKQSGQGCFFGAFGSLTGRKMLSFR